MAINGKEEMQHAPNFSQAFHQIANFVAISKTKSSSETLDAIIQQCYVILPDESLNTSAEVTSAIRSIFGIPLSEKDVGEGMRRLLDKGVLITLPIGHVGLFSEVKNHLDNNILEAKNLEEKVKKSWLAEISIKNGDLDLIKLWDALKAYLCSAFRRHGVQVIALLDQTSEIAKEKSDGLAPALDSVIGQRFDRTQRKNAHDAVSSFFIQARKDRNRAEYISQLADTAFNYFSLTVPPEVSEQLRSKLNPLALFLDTNFLFGILNLHFNPQLDISTELITAIKKFHLPFKLYYHEATSYETSNTITYWGDELGRHKYSQQISRAVVKSGVLLSSGIEIRYHQKNAEHPIKVEDFISPYRKWQFLLQQHGIDIYRVSSSKERLLKRASFEFEYKDFLTRNGREKPHEAIQHDMAVLETVRSLRSNVKNTLGAGAIFVTCDYHLCRFDWESSHREKMPRCTVLPSHLWQILRPFVTESEQFDQAFAETFALPEFTLAKGDAMRAASRMIGVLSTYEDFPEDTAIKMMTNDLLIGELQQKTTEDDFYKAIDSAIARENSLLMEERAILEKRLISEQNEKECLVKDTEKNQQKLHELEKILSDTKKIVEDQSSEINLLKKSGADSMSKFQYKGIRDKKFLGIITAVCAAIIFELSIRQLHWSWLLNHENSYALQGAFCSMIIFLILAIIVPSWRKICFIVGFMAILAVAIPLLGGPASLPDSKITAVKS